MRCVKRGIHSAFLPAFLALSALLPGICAQAQTTAITLAWDALTNSNVAGYRLYQGSASRSYTSWVNAGANTQSTASNLTLGATYYFAVTAYTSSGLESDYSAELAYTVTTNSTPPATDLPPVITLTSPTDGAGYVAPATINLAASVVANGHSISKVQFYQGTTLLGESLGAPYSYSWTAVAGGVYNISARLIYDGSLSLASAVSTVSVTNLVSPPPVLGGLVAAYGFDEGAGGTVSDASGFGNAGTINGASWISTGHFGKALGFNGSSSAVLVNDSLSLDLTTGMTLEAWVYPTVLGNWDEIIYKGDDNYFLEAATPVTTGPSVGVGDSGIYPMVSAPNPLPIGRWTHLGATYDGVTLKVFVNGVLVASRLQTGLIGTSMLPLSIGADTLHGSYYNGVIDEVRIYNRALSASEIQTDMNTPVSGGTAPQAPPAVVLSSPANGSSYLAPANLNLTADVTANGHTINKVQFYNGSTLLGETAAPYSLSWNNLPAGNYSLTVRVMYDGSLTVDSTAVSISVTNSEPTIVLSAPTSGETYVAPASVQMVASVTANGNPITKVQFYDGATLLGESSSAPYAFNWNNVSAGSYSLKGRVIYDTGSIDSAPVTVTVTNPPPTITMTSPLDGSTNIMPANLTLAADVTPNGHDVASVRFVDDTNVLAEVLASPYVFTWTNVSAGTHRLQAQVVYDGFNTVGSVPVTVTVLALPPPWESVDIGTVPTVGSGVFSNGMFTVQGSGNFNWTSDNFQFLYQALSGDGEIIAQIPSADDGSRTALAGAMIRESLTPDSTYVFMGTASDRFRRQRRNVTGGASIFSTWSNTRFPGFWVRIVRAGDVFTRYESDDGVNWGFADIRTIPMASEIYIGLAVASESATNQTTATFSNIRVIP